jgi:putative transposase
MPLPRPDYLAYTVPCPLNAGKLARVVDFVKHWRGLATREAAWQWRHFFTTGGSEGFQASARAGWTREWVTSRDSTVTLAQQVMAQVAGQLTGHLGNVQNTFTRLVSSSSLSADDKHRLFYLNRCRLWLFKGAVKSPVAGEDVLSRDVRQLGRKLFHRALAQHRRPHFRHYHPQLDQRSVKLRASEKAKAFPLWAKISTRQPGQTIALPVSAWPALMETIASTSKALATAQEERQQQRQKKTEQKQQVKAHAKSARKTPRKPRAVELCSLPQTIRVIVQPNHEGDPKESPRLSLGLVVDHAGQRAQDRAAYKPIPGKVVAFDLGMATLLATSEGDLLGRGWQARLERLDLLLQGIARGQQKRGLPVATPRYRALTRQLDGFLKTEIFRMVNAWVARVRPEKIVREAVGFHLQPGLSKRLNRLLSRFGKRYLEQALTRLEATHGIVVETREAAYSSQQCHACGYVDAKNRASQSKFHCRFCSTRVHADVNAARVVRDRRSISASPSTAASRRRLLHAQVAAFQAAHPGVSRASSCRGKPLARGRRDDPRLGNPYFSVVLEAALKYGQPTPPSGFAAG